MLPAVFCFKMQIDQRSVVRNFHLLTTYQKFSQNLTISSKLITDQRKRQKWETLNRQVEKSCFQSFKNIR